MPPRLLLPLAAVAAAASLVSAQAPAPAPFVSVKTPAYDLYASNQALLAAASAQLDSAGAQFARYFPGPAPKIHVVVAATRDELQRFDIEGLRKQTGNVLAWTVTVTRTAAGGGIMEMAPASGTPKIALLGNLSAVLAPVIGAKGVVVHFVPPSGPGGGADLREGDVIMAIDDRPVSDPAALNAAYNPLATGARVQLRVERQGNTRTIAFTKPAGEPRPITQNNSLAQGPRSGGSEPRVLSHEAGHHLLIQWVTERAGGKERVAALLRARSAAAKADTSELLVAYGSPLLPDWADEAAATISESKSQQSERRKYIADNFGLLIPFSRFFAAEHPAVPGLREMAKAQVASGERTEGPRSVRVRSSVDGIDGAMFYAQSLSVAEFLLEREGAPFMGQLFETLMRGGSVEDALKSAKRLPQTIDALNAEWLKWVTR
jgi:hypothetical protein